MIEFENVSCGLCGSSKYVNHLCRGDLSLFLEGKFQLVRCSECGLVYLNPRPAQASMAEIYPDHYDQYTPTLKDEPSPIKRWERIYGLRKRIKPIIGQKKTGRLLDVGCATGDFLEVMQMSKDWELHGVEISSSASDHARLTLNLPIVTGSLEDAKYQDNFFDVITMWNVIEHLSDPLATLKELRRILKPDGLLVFNTPNLDSLDAKIFKQYWIGYELPRHFYVFSNKTLDKMLTKAGFTTVETRCLYGSHALSMSSLRFFFRANLPSRVEKVLSSLIMSLPFRFLTLPYFYVVDRLNWSTAPTTVCVKHANNSE